MRAQVEHVTVVSHEEPLPVDRGLQPSGTAAVATAWLFLAFHVWPQPDVRDQTRRSSRQARHVVGVDVAVRDVDHIDLAIVGSDRNTVARRAQGATPREAARVNRVQHPTRANARHLEAGIPVAVVNAYRCDPSIVKGRTPGSSGPMRRTMRSVAVDAT